MDGSAPLIVGFIAGALALYLVQACLAPAVSAVAGRLSVRKHRHRELEVGSIRVDEGIASAVAWAQRHDHATTCSCQGGAGVDRWHDPSAYVKFASGSGDGAHELFETLRAAGVPAHLTTEEPCGEQGDTTYLGPVEHVVSWPAEFRDAVEVALAPSA